MIGIEIQSATVDYPIFDVGTRSFKSQFFHMGGAIQRGPRHVSIRALEDITLSMAEGERVGIVGLNGAGKSTLLRLLAGIYEPSRGRVAVRGTVAPLFDIMVGIDPDATGRENIRIRGLLLGLSPRQIAACEDEVVAFSELADYIHMPIRTYSVGMRLRLAFALATAYEPEILLVDELIGVGDARFMQQAQTRLARHVMSARILVLATHATEVMRQLCTRGILLHQGRLVADGPIDTVLHEYGLIVER